MEVVGVDEAGNDMSSICRRDGNILGPKECTAIAATCEEGADMEQAGGSCLVNIYDVGTRAIIYIEEMSGSQGKQ
jgi:hypothetical protein